MAAPTSTLNSIFGPDTEPPTCGGCAGVGLVGTGNDEVPSLCERCGGGFADPIFDPTFVARHRKPMTDPELDEAAIEFGDALLQGIADIERLLETGDLPLASMCQPKAR